MKKFLYILFLIVIVNPFFYWWTFAWDCDIDTSQDNLDISTELGDCLSDTTVVPVSDNVALDWWFQIVILSWVNNIAIILAVLAVWSIVFGALLLTLSTWEDEKIKKAKDVIKWWILWLLWVVTASTMVTLVVKIMYSI